MAASTPASKGPSHAKPRDGETKPEDDAAMKRCGQAELEEDAMHPEGEPSSLRHPRSKSRVEPTLEENSKPQNQTSRPRGTRKGSGGQEQELFPKKSSAASDDFDVSLMSISIPKSESREAPFRNTPVKRSTSALRRISSASSGDGPVPSGGLAPGSVPLEGMTPSLDPNKPSVRPALPLNARPPENDPARLRSSVYRAMQAREHATCQAYLDARKLAQVHERISGSSPRASDEEETEELENEDSVQPPRNAAAPPRADPGFDLNPSSVSKARMTKRTDRMDALLAKHKPLWDLPQVQQKELIQHGQDFPHLPPVRDWREALEYGFDKDTSFHAVNHFFINNSDTVEKIISHLHLDQGPPRFIVEGYAGAGTVTQRFLRHPNVGHVYALEDAFQYWSWLRRLENPPPDAGVDGSRLTVFPFSAWEWNTYSDLEKGGAFDLALRDRAVLPSQMSGNEVLSFDSDDWKEDIPLEVFMTIPNTVLGEQLVVQLISAIGNRTWLFRYGRVKVHLIITENLADRLVIEPGTFNRSKINVVTEALATVQYRMRGDEFFPLTSHTYSAGQLVVGKGAYSRAVRVAGGPRTDNAASGLNRQRLAFVTITPRKDPLVTPELYPTFDWLMKNVLVLRTNTIYQSLRHVAPGAEEIVHRLAPGGMSLRSQEEAIKPSERVCDLTAKQLVALARVFDIWPFKPPEVELEIANGTTSDSIEDRA